jgi:hypothetical protein
MFVFANLAVKSGLSFRAQRETLVLACVCNVLACKPKPRPLAALGMTTDFPYFQKGFFNPAGARALFGAFASVPESSDIFSS